MEARFVEFNEALKVLAQGLREGALSLAEFRLRRRQLLLVLMTPLAGASEAGSSFETSSRPPSRLPEVERTRPRRGMVAAVLLLVLLLALVLFGTLA